jgi:glycosyltransferase involved in cell wall biosynthesis
MRRIAYLLHRFPCTTDTFIKREIRSLQKLGSNIDVISVWKPREVETTPQILEEWASNTYHILPRSGAKIALSLLNSIIRSPKNFIATIYLAVSTSYPGIRGFIYQTAYFIEAVLVAERLQRNRIHHVHNHIGDQSGTVTMLAARMAGISFSITFHGWPVFFDAKNSRIKEKVRKGSFTRSISYFCRSQLMMFSETDDLTSFKIVHCGLNLEKYTFRLPKKQVTTLFCAARLAPEKGLAFALRALKLLVEKGHDLNLRLAGDGPSKKGLEELAEKLGISRHVHFLGYLAEEQVISELGKCDLFVLSSFVEGIPVSAMEAMAIGVPVIATNIAGTSELIEDGKSGLLVRPSDAQVLADAIVKMIDDYDFRLRAADLGRKKVEDEFDVDKESVKLNKYFLECFESVSEDAPLFVERCKAGRCQY